MMYLNENDIKLLIICSQFPLSVTEIANKMGIAPKNVSVRLKKLESMKLITIDDLGKGKKKRIKTMIKINVNKELMNKWIKINNEMKDKLRDQIINYIKIGESYEM